jgi:hypothetical protein
MDCVGGNASAGRRGEGLMGKYIFYALAVLVILFALEWFEIVDVPFLEIPNITGQKKEILDRSKDAMDKF